MIPPRWQLRAILSFVALTLALLGAVMTPHASQAQPMAAVTSSAPSPVLLLSASNDGVPLQASPLRPRQTSAPAETKPSPTPTPAPTPSPQAVAPPAPVQPVPAAKVDCKVAHCVALTYDDGPNRYTSKLLDELQAANVRATFFLVGRQVVINTAVVQRMQQMGMVIGNHTMTHPRFTKISTAAQAGEINATSRVIQAATGVRPTLLRTPFGEMTPGTKTLGWPIIMWNVDTRDWATDSGPASLAVILAQVKRGSIILMHDVMRSSVDETPAIIAALRARGYTLVTVPELLGSPQPNKVYYGGR